MSFKSMGDFIAAAEKLGDVKMVHGADLDLDVGCLTEIAYEEDGPMLVFDRFKGFPDDFRVVTNVFRNSIRQDRQLRSPQRRRRTRPSDLYDDRPR